MERHGGLLDFAAPGADGFLTGASSRPVANFSWRWPARRQFRRLTDRAAAGKSEPAPDHRLPVTRLLADYVKVYDGTLPPAACEALIARFEAEAALQERMQADRSYRFTEINVSRHWPEVEQQIFAIMTRCMQDYWRQLAIGPCWPTKVGFEKLRLKRYLPGGEDKFPVHVDVMSEEESRRFLTAILYLNTPGGGETTFPKLDISVAPAPGRMVVFPPLWLFPHAGLPPRGRPKYILHRYMWYEPSGKGALD
jgi:hypothetical protein